MKAFIKGTAIAACFAALLLTIGGKVADGSAMKGLKEFDERMRQWEMKARKIDVIDAFFRQFA